MNVAFEEQNKHDAIEKNLRSVNGFNTKKRTINNDIYKKYIDEKENIFLAELLASRGIKYEDKDSFLWPKLKNLLPKVGILKDTNKAVDRILQAILNQENIYIFGDYDVDGLTSTTMLVLFLKKFCANVKYYIPNRIVDGYGPNCELMEKIANDNAKVLICVDCGIVAFEALKKAKLLGLDVIVLDHHKSADTMPECVACVDPNRIDETDIPYELHSLCACGVSFLFLIALCRLLKEHEQTQLQRNKTIENNCCYENNNTEINNIISNSVKSIDLMHFTPLVAFATICDVMNLTALNRAFVKTGLNVLHKEKSFNLHELLKIASSSSSSPSSSLQSSSSPSCPSLPNDSSSTSNNNNAVNFTAYTFGFLLGPIINAGGRIGDPALGVELMLSRNIQKTSILAEKLCCLNNERKSMEATVLHEVYTTQNNEIQKQINEQGFILLNSKNWHEGIIGLIASRLKEKYFYPAIIGTELENQTIKFSSRSVDGVDIGEIILQAYDKNLLINGGGHKLAGGFTCEISKVEKLQQFFKKKIKINADKNFINKTITYDIAISLGGINFDLLEKITNFAPFGVGNEKIIFLLQDVKICSINVLRDKHISIIIADKNKTGRAVCFNCIGTELGDFLLSSKNKTVSFITSIDIGEYKQHKTINIVVTDAIEQKLQ